MPLVTEQPAPVTTITFLQEPSLCRRELRALLSGSCSLIVEQFEGGEAGAGGDRAVTAMIGRAGGVIGLFDGKREEI